MTKSDFLMVAGALAVLFAVKNFLPKSEEQKAVETSSEVEQAKYKAMKSEICPGIRIKVDPLISTGFIMNHSKDWSEVKVSRAWYQTPLDKKENTIKVIAMCLSPGEILSVYDGYSGELLAKSGILGLKVYK